MADTPKTLPKQAGREFGRSGTYVSNGYIHAEDYNQELTGKSAIRMWEIMRRSDPTIRAMLQVCILPLLSANWDIEASEDDPEGEDKADFIKRETMKRNVNWHDFMRQGFSMLPMGFSVAEKTFELCDWNGQPRIGLNKIGYRKQISIDKWLTEDGKPGVTQRLYEAVDGKATISIPREKLIIFTHDKEGDNDEGISILRYAFKPWKMKEDTEVIQMVGIEKQAIGVPVLKKDPAVTVGPDEIEKAREALRQFRSNEEAFIDSTAGLLVEMLDMKSSSNKEVMPYLEYLKREIVKSVLAPFLELGSGSSGGSHALSTDQTALFSKSLEAIAQTFASAVQEQLIKQLCDLNFSDMSKGYPKLVFSGISDTDITTLSDAVQKLTSSGVLTADPDMEQHFRDQLKLPALSKELRDGYEERRLAAKAASEALASGVTPDGKPADKKTTDNKETKKLPEDTKDKTVKPDKVKASAVEDLLDESRKVNRRIIKVLSLD